MPYLPILLRQRQEADASEPRRAKPRVIFLSARGNVMPVAPFDFSSLLPAGLPPAAAKWNGAARYNFIGGNNDPAQIPVDALAAAATAVLTREGPTLASYGLKSGPQGYRPLREFIAGKLKRDAAIACTPDDILGVSGSLQAPDLINGVLLARGDPCDEREQQRDPCRLVLEVDRARLARRLHRGALAHPLARARAQDRWRHRRARADGARRVLRPAIRDACAAAAARAARQARGPDGFAQ